MTFSPGAPVSMWDWGPMIAELKSIFGRRVDLVEKAAIKNPLRRKHILDGHQILFAS